MRKIKMDCNWQSKQKTLCTNKFTRICVLGCLVNSWAIFGHDTRHWKRRLAFLLILLFIQSQKHFNSFPDSCPTGWKKFEEYCYLASSSLVSSPRNDAVNYCNSLGADLVKINGPKENEFVLNLARQQAPSVEKFWIGLSIFAHKWSWDDQSLPVFTKWHPGEPNGQNNDEGCAEMFIEMKAEGFWNGYWNDIPCGETSKGLVCKKLA